MESAHEDSYLTGKPHASILRKPAETVRKRIRQELETDNNRDSTRNAKRPIAGSTEPTKASLELKKYKKRLDYLDNGVAKRKRVRPPILVPGLVSSRLKQSFKVPFNTPFKNSLEIALCHPCQNTGTNQAVKTRMPTTDEGDLVEPTDNALGNVPLVTNKGEAVENADVRAVRSCESKLPGSIISN